MAQCPVCGTRVDDQVDFCPGCGTVTGQEGGRSNQPQSQQTAQPRQGPEQETRGQRGQGGGQPSQKPPGSSTVSTSETSRRSLLKIGGGVAVVGMGGFLLWDMFLGGSSPKEVVREFWQALNDGNVDRADELTQFDLESTGFSSTSTSKEFEQQEISVESAERHDKSAGEAIVRSDIQITGGGNSKSLAIDHELLKESGEWKIDSLSLQRGYSVESAGQFQPQAAFDSDYGEGDTSSSWGNQGSGDSALRVSHDGGDDILSTNLYMTDGPNGRLAWSDALTDFKVKAGTSVKYQVESDDTVRVIWSDGNSSEEMMKWTGPDA